VLDLEILVIEFSTVNGLSSSSVMVGEITTLSHEVVDDSVEMRVLVSESLGMKTKLSEVIGSLGYDVVEEFKYDFSGFVSSEIEVEEDFGFAHKIYCMSEIKIIRSELKK
jgi:hypothetical protein